MLYYPFVAAFYTHIPPVPPPDMIPTLSLVTRKRTSLMIKEIKARPSKGPSSSHSGPFSELFGLKAAVV